MMYRDEAIQPLFHKGQRARHRDGTVGVVMGPAYWFSGSPDPDRQEQWGPHWRLAVQPDDEPGEVMMGPAEHWEAMA